MGNYNQSSSGSGKSNPQMTPEQLLQLYGQALPQIAQVTGQTISPINTSLAQSASAANPIYTQNDLSQLGGLAPGFQNQR